MKGIFIISLCLMGGSAYSYAAPNELVIDSKVKPKSYERYIRAVHKEIPASKNIKFTRFAIIEGMLNTKGIAWVFEGEGDGYILARFDYRGDTNVMRIEYDDKLVQLKYHAALGDYICENNLEDICYKNGRGYYNYIKNLRNSIKRELAKG